MKRHGIVTHVEFLMPEFDDLDKDEAALLERLKRDPDPYHPTTFQRLNFGELT